MSLMGRAKLPPTIASAWGCTSSLFPLPSLFDHLGFLDFSASQEALILTINSWTMTMRQRTSIRGVCPSFGPWRFRQIQGKSIFLDASSHLYMRVCPSVGPSVGLSVGNANFENLIKWCSTAENDRELVQKVFISVKSIKLSYLHPSKCPNAIRTHRCPARGLVYTKNASEVAKAVSERRGRLV